MVLEGVHLPVAIAGLLAAALVALAARSGGAEAPARRWTFRHSTRTHADLGMWAPATGDAPRAWRVEPFAEGTGGRALASGPGARADDEATVLLVEGGPARDVHLATRCHAELPRGARGVAACGVVVGWSEGGYLAVGVEAASGEVVVSRVTRRGARDAARDVLAEGRPRRERTEASPWRDLEVEARGATLRVRVDGDEVVTLSLPDPPHGLPGLWTSAGSSAFFDELTLRAGR